MTTKKILYLDDEISRNDVLIAKLMQYKYDLETVPNVDHAYSLIIHEKNIYQYDLIIADLYMDACSLSSRYQQYRSFGGFCILKEIFTCGIKIKKLVYTHITNNNDTADIFKYLDSQEVRCIQKLNNKNDSNIDKLISAVKELLTEESHD